MLALTFAPPAVLMALMIPPMVLVPLRETLTTVPSLVVIAKIVLPRKATVETPLVLSFNWASAVFLRQVIDACAGENVRARAGRDAKGLR